MRGDLLGAHSLEEGLHVVEVREHHRVLVTVVRMHVSLSHALQVLLIVALSVLLVVGGLDGLLGLGLDGLHLVLVCGLELGLDVEGDRTKLAKSQSRLNYLTKE